MFVTGGFFLSGIWPKGEEMEEMRDKILQKRIGKMARKRE